MVERLRPRSAVPIDESGVHAAEVRGDPDQLGRAVGNLLENACRYARTTVTVMTSVRPATLEIVVANDGPPVPEADRSRIFERFAAVGRLTDAWRPGAPGWASPSAARYSSPTGAP